MSNGKSCISNKYSQKAGFFMGMPQARLVTPGALALLTCLIAGALPAATVKDFGAVGNGSKDDTAAIQAAIDSTAFGGTLTFPAGTYLLTRSLVFRSNHTYQGQPGAILHTGTQDFAGITEYDSAANLTIDSLVFDGGGLMFAGSSAPGNNVHVTHCTFQNIFNSTGNWPAHNGIFIAAGLTGGSTIAYNRFANIYEPGSMEDVEVDHTAAGIFMYNLAQTSITDNTFDTVYQGISAQFSGAGPYSGILIARNTFNQLHRMGIEMQGGSTQGMIIDSNHLDNFHNPWYDTFALSIVVDGGSQTQITNNYMAANPAPYSKTSQGVRYGLGIEIGGHNTVVSSNTVANIWGWSVAVGAAPNVSVQNNIICNGGATGAIGYEAGVQPGAVTTPNSIVGTCPSVNHADTTPPTVSLTSPASGAVLAGTTTLSANANDNVGVASVAFMVDGALSAGTVAVSPFSVQFNTATLTNGSHTITAVAADAAGNKATSAAVTVTVSNNVAPVPPPPTIPSAGLSMWLRADQGVTLAGTKVSRWADQSGRGADASQPVAASQPSFIASDFKSKPALRFDGASSFLGFNLPINGLTGMTILLVGNNRANQQGGSVYAQSSAVYWGESAWWGVTYLSPFQSNVAYRFGTTQAGNLPDYIRPASAGTNFTLTTAVKNGTTETLYINGQKLLASTGKLTTVAGSTNSGYIGRGDLNTYFSGDISEIIVYNRALTDAERQTVEAYLMARNLQ